jgi:hypothetical protein
LTKTSILASLHFIGDDFDTDYVTAVLNKKPDEIRAKGDLRKYSMSRYDCTIWSIDFKESESIDMDTHLIPLFDFIEQNLEKLQLLTEELDAEWHIAACISIRNGHAPAIVLTPRQMELASKIKAYMDFDLYIL